MHLQHRYETQLLNEEAITIDNVRSKDNLTNPMTKSLAKEKNVSKTH